MVHTCTLCDTRSYLLAKVQRLDICYAYAAQERSQKGFKQSEGLH